MKKPVCNKIKCSNGFTLLEVMGAMLILSIIAVIFVPWMLSSAEGIRRAGDKSEQIYAARGIVDKEISQEIVYRGGTIPIEVRGANGKAFSYSVRGGIVEKEGIVTFLPQVPSVSLQPDRITEGSGVVNLNVRGIYTNFARNRTSVAVENRDENRVGGFVVDVTGSELLTLRTPQGLTNFDSPYTIFLSTSDEDQQLEVVRTRLFVELPAFAAVGHGNMSNAIIVSADGKSWNPSAGMDHIPQIRLNSVVWGDGQFVAVGEAGTVLLRTEGELWIRYSAGQTALMEVAYGKLNGVNTYAAVGANGVIYLSKSGWEWTKAELRIENPGVDFYGAAFGNNQLIVVGSGGTIVATKDGQTWQQQSLFPQIEQRLTSVAFGGTDEQCFMAVGENGVVYYRLADSSGENTWHRLTDNLGADLNAVVWGGASASTEKFVAVGARGTVLTISPNLVCSPSSVLAGNLHDVVFAWRDGEIGFMAVNENGQVGFSQDGYSWSFTKGLNGTPYGIAVRR